MTKPSIKNLNTNKIKPTLKVDVDKVDAIMDLCGELVVIKSQLEQQSVIRSAMTDVQLTGILNLLGNTIRDVYEQTMSMRMISLKPTIMRLERSVQEVALNLNKQVQFQVEGDELELDRSLIEQISDPLMHLCRNAVDHGFESKAERVKLNKPAMGTLRLRAYSEGSNVIIELTDDGQGIDRTKTLAKAREKGLISKDRLDQDYTDEEISNFLFAPGFTTAAAITEISGRGIGLDVVRSTVRSMKGDVSIKSTPGEGCTFKMVLPLSTAITDGILVRVAHEEFIFPLGIVSEFVSLTSAPLQNLNSGQTVIRIRDQYLPILKLGDHFGLKTDVAAGIALIVKSATGLVAVIVDAVIGQSQIVMKKVDECVHNNALIAGAAVMGNGRVVLVIDPSSTFGLPQAA